MKATILEKIIRHKYDEVKAAERQRPLQMLKEQPFYDVACRDFSHKLRQTPGVIAEFKRKSPSKANIAMEVEPLAQANAYDFGGAAAISVLTDRHFFGGSTEDLVAIRNAVALPLLRKDFTVVSYQVHEAKAYGADAILLIAAALEPAQLQSLAAEAKEIGLDVLVEVHDSEELSRALLPTVDMIGVNNRNLKTFEVDLKHSLCLGHDIPQQYVKISESGIQDADDIVPLLEAGFDGFLIGEALMRSGDPIAQLRRFTTKIAAVKMRMA